MTVYLQNPDALIREVESYGASLKKDIHFDPEHPLMEIQSQFNGEEYSPSGEEADAEFGGIFSVFSPKKHLGKIVSKATGKNVKITKINVGKSLAGTAAVGLQAAAYIPGLSKLDSVASKLKSVTKTVGTIKAAVPAKAIASFSLPKKISVNAALKSADRLIGSKKTPAAVKQQIINNTKALAALGDKSAQKSVLVLNAASKIRVATKTPIGQPAITKPAPKPVVPAIKQTSKSTVLQLAQNTNAKKDAITKQGWWPRFKHWVSIHYHGGDVKKV